MFSGDRGWPPDRDHCKRRAVHSNAQRDVFLFRPARRRLRTRVAAIILSGRDKIFYRRRWKTFLRYDDLKYNVVLSYRRGRLRRFFSNRHRRRRRRRRRSRNNYYKLSLLYRLIVSTEAVTTTRLHTGHIGWFAEHYRPLFFLELVFCFCA